LAKGRLVLEKQLAMPFSTKDLLEKLLEEERLAGKFHCHRSRELTSDQDSLNE